MRAIVAPTLVFLLLLSSPRAASAGPLRMEFANGYVTISASDVSLRQVLTEWGRLGHTRVVNGEKVGGALLTLELSHVPEKQALEIVLRSVPGYLVAERTTAIQGGSQYDRIVVMPGTVAPPGRNAAAPPPPPPPVQQVQAPAMPVEDQDQPVQEVPEQVAAEQEEQPQPAAPQLLPQPGIQPMPPNPPGQGQNDPNVTRQPGGPVPVPAAGAVVSQAPGQLPVPPKPQPDQ